MSHLLRSLHDAGVQTLLLKGVPLVLHYYQDYGLRPMDDLDILVPPHQVSSALQILKTHGFVPDWDTRDEADVLATRHGWDFKNAAGRGVDVHWRVFHDGYDAQDADADFRDGAVPITVHGIPSTTLNAADHLLHVCVHGATWTQELAVRWVADAMAILTAVDGALNWDRLVAQARRYRFILLLRATLAYLRDLVDAPIPSEVLRRIKEMPVSRAERVVYQAKTRPTECWGPWVALGVRYLEYCASQPSDAGVLRRLVGLPAYFARRWGTGSVWQIPAAAAFRGTRRIAWAARTRWVPRTDPPSPLSGRTP